MSNQSLTHCFQLDQLAKGFWQCHATLCLKLFYFPIKWIYDFFSPMLWVYICVTSVYLNNDMQMRCNYAPSGCLDNYFIQLNVKYDGLAITKFSDNHQPENSKYKNVTEIRDFWGDTVLCFVAHIKMVFSHVSFKYK